MNYGLKTLRKTLGETLRKTLEEAMYNLAKRKTLKTFTDQSHVINDFFQPNSID